MFFLRDDERKLVFRRLLPGARRSPVAEELRGWNWPQPPLAPVYDVPLAVYEVAGGYCASGRDVYLRRVKGTKVPPNRLMVEGSVLHATIARFIVEAKRAIYGEGGDVLRRLAALAAPSSVPIDERRLSEEEAGEIRRRSGILWDFEYHRVVARVEEVLSRHKYIGPDALAALALPITVEQKLDGSLLGLSAHLSADAFSFAEPMLMDLKFDEKRRFHRLAVAAYALVMESLHEYPVDLGCVVYAGFSDGRVIVERDFFAIDDELRQWFLDARDEKSRLVSEEIDPGLAAECYENCVYRAVCTDGGAQPARAGHRKRGA